MGSAAQWSPVVGASSSAWTPVEETPANTSGIAAPTTPTQFFQALREHLWPSAAGVVSETASAYKNTGPQGGTLPPRDPRIPEDAPFYGFRKTLLDLEDAAKSIYDKVTHPASTLASDPVGVVADFGKLASSIKIAKDMAEGKPAPSLDLSAIKDKLKSVVSKLPEVSPETRDVIGVVSPRAKNLLGVSQRLRDAAEAGAPETAAVPADPILDKIAQGMGGKDFASLPPEAQSTVRGIADKLNQSGGATATTIKPAPASVEPIEWRTPEEIAAAQKAAVPAPTNAAPTVLPTPSPTPAPIPEGVDLTEKLRALLRQERIRAGDNPDLPLGHVQGASYQNYWDEGAVKLGANGQLVHDSQVIDSSLRKPYSTADIANPSKIMTRAEFRATIRPGSPLLKSTEAFDKAYKAAVQLKATGSINISDLMK